MSSKKTNQSLYQKATQLIPSGVNSPVRAFKAVGGTPLFVRRGKGAWFWDEEEKAYLDFCGSWGALLFGHAPDELIQKLRGEMALGLSFGTATSKEVLLAEKIRRVYPSMTKLRLVSSGTEAVMSAIRLARGYTGRNKILKIDGGYHGHVDSLLVKAGSGVATFGLADSAGVPEDLAKLTLSIPFNNISALEEAFDLYGKEIAAFILEPIPANMGLVIPKAGYLQKVRQLTQYYGTVLIFDEVISGFRVAAGGAQEAFHVSPDLTCLGKIIGGGLPLAAFGGKEKIMNCLAPEGPVYQAGTLSGNPAAVTAALWVINQLEKKKKDLNALSKRSKEFAVEFAEVIRKRKYPVTLNAIESVFTLFFSPNEVFDYESAKKSNTIQYAAFFHACLKKGVYLAPAQFEANFISTSHSQKDLDKALSIFSKNLQDVLS